MSGQVVGNLTVRLDFDGSQFERGIAQAKRELSTYNKAVGMATRIAKDNNYEMGRSGDALHNMRQAYRGNAKMVETLTKRNEELRKSGSDTGQIEKNINHIRNHEMAMYDLDQEYKQFQKEMITANSAFTKFGDGAVAVGDTMVNVGDGVSRIGTGITKAGLAVGGTLGLAVKQAITFEQGLANVQKTTNASSAEMEVLESDIRGLATTMPIATDELLALGEQAGQLGIPQESIAEFTETMAKMGTATNLSAEEAGESFARFVNITGHGLEDLDKLGSAVVHLGNNFATSESEIMNLAMGLAGSLTTVGVAEADILGLSTGMSALGINAERGASSMSKFFIEMAQDVASGSGNLEHFAEVSGMTASEFQQAFEDDAMGAVETFITGLGELDESGGDVIGTLEKMGINEVRLRDTILRLAKGHDVLSDALVTSNEGYEEGNALQEEYEVLAETTASQMEIAKNKLKDLSLSMGQALLPAIIDIIDSTDGLVSSLETGVEWFVNLDDATKETIVQFTAFSLVGGPILSMFGNLISGGGSLLRGLGMMSKGVGRLKGSLLSELLPSLSETAGATGETAGALEGFGESAGLAAGPRGVGLFIDSIVGSAGLPWALGIAALALAGWAGWKLWGEGIAEANRQTEEWGTTLSSNTEGTLSSVKEDLQSVTGQFNLMSQGFDTDSASMVENMKSIGNTIQEDLINQLDKTEEYLEDLPENLRESQERILEQHRNHLEQTLGLVEENTTKINEIEQRASNENRELRTEELAYIRELQNESLGKYIDTLELTADEERTIRSVLAGDVDKLTKEQAAQTFATFKEQNDNIKQQQREDTEELKELIKEMGLNPDEGLGKELMEDNDRYWESITKSSERSMSEIIEAYPELIKEFNLTTGEIIDETTEGYEAIVKTNEYIVDGLANSYRDMEKQANASNEATSQILEHSAVGAKAWNDVVARSGETVEDFQNEIRDATNDVNTWNELRPVIHNADLDSNTKMIIAQALIENGRWEELRWDEKQALLHDNFSYTTYQALEASGRWDELEWKEQQAILNNQFSGTVAEALIDDGTWSDLEWREQKAILLSNTPEQIRQALKDIGIWDGLDPEIQDLIVNNEGATKPTKEASDELGEYNKITTPIKYPKVDASGAIRPATEAEIAIGDYNKTNVPNKNITATDNASSKAKSARSNLLNIPSVVTSTIRTVRETIFGNEKGTNFHPGGLAMVNDERSNRFRELVTLPDGQQFIPEGKNVTLDLPRGSKVLRASLTQRMFPDLPQYADGIGLQTTRVPKAFSEPRRTQQSEISSLQSQINQLVRVISAQQAQQQVTTEGVTINIEKIENHTEHDIPKILEEASWIMRGEGKRLYG